MQRALQQRHQARQRQARIVHSGVVITAVRRRPPAAVPGSAHRRGASSSGQSLLTLVAEPGQRQTAWRRHTAWPAVGCRSGPQTLNVVTVDMLLSMAWCPVPPAVSHTCLRCHLHRMGGCHLGVPWCAETGRVSQRSCTERQVVMAATRVPMPVSRGILHQFQTRGADTP